MAPILVAISVISALVHLGTDVVGLDLSIAQDQAGKAKLSTLVAPISAPVASSPPPVAMARPPVAPSSCPAMLGTMREDDLNRIELARVTGRCR